MQAKGLVVLLLVAGCGDPSAPPAPDGKPAGCGPGSCKGCCMAELCVEGNTNSVCGLGGSACIDCASSGQTCVNGSCQGVAACGTATCTTCCQGNQCAPALDDTACGLGGTACANCVASGTTCDLAKGSCASSTSCGPTTCATGCCKAGTCVKGDEDGACGTGGGTCASCTASGKSCGTKKTCEAAPSCGPASCASGCCAGDVCESGSTSSQCGSNGAACAACQSFASCSGGTCVVSATSKWKVTAVGATISTTKQWDGGGSAPDPYFGIDWGGCTSWNLNKCSSWDSDTNTPVWNADMGTVPASTLKGSWCAFVMDGDGLFACSPPYQTMGRCTVVVTDADLSKGSKTVNSCPCPDDNVNYVTNLKLIFTHVP